MGGAMNFFGWLVHRFGSERLGATSTRGRQPRLALIDAAKVDERRHLILVRRDNVEHLLMIGGPTDILVEPNVMRAAARETAPMRSPTVAEAIQYPAASQNETAWALQPESTPTIP